MKSFFTILLLIISVQSICYGQSCVSGDIAEIRGTRSNTCLQNFSPVALLSKIYNDSDRISVKVSKNGSTEIFSKTFLPSEYTAIRNGKYEYSLTNVNVSNHNDAYSFTTYVLVYKIEFDFIFNGPFPIPVPIIVPISSCIKTVYRCLNDKDYDGIVNTLDSCPNVANTGNDSDGDGIDDACDQSSDLSDLVVDLDDSKVFSQCISCSPFLDQFFRETKRHLIAGSVGNINFNRLEIRNIGKKTSNAAKISFYFSRNNTLNKDDDKLVKNISIPSRGSNISYGIQTSITGTDILGSGASSSANNGSYFILIEIDSSNSNNEGSEGENNNFLAIPISYNSSSTASYKFVENSLHTKDQVESLYLFEVFNMYGQRLFSKKIRGLAEEQRIIDELPKGLFIIKDDHRTYKLNK